LFLCQIFQNGSLLNMSYVTIQLIEMDQLLKPEKGWIRNLSGNEYVYDYHLMKYPVIVKVLSTIQVNIGNPRNKGSDAIRIFSVRKSGLDKKAKVISGLVKSIIVYREPNWQDRVKRAVLKMIEESKRKYDRYGR
jgi:hypothetical protein